MSPVHVTAEVLASKRIGAFQHVTLVAPGVGERFRPGAFVAVSVGTGGYHLARRAFWIHQVRPLGGYAATVTLVVEPRGEGTRWLATRQRGDRVEPDELFEHELHVAEWCGVYGHLVRACPPSALKHLARVHDAFGIEGRFDRLHQV